MSLFALSFYHADDKAQVRHYVYKFVPITPEQARMNITAKEIPAGAVGSVIMLFDPTSGTPVHYMIVGDNKFRPLTMDELAKHLQAGSNV